MAGESQQPPRKEPDPTILTTEQLERAIENLKELMDAKMEANERECLEKFSSMGQRFELVERQRVEQKTDTKVAVDAALSAAEKAVKEQTTASELAIGKSEAATVKSIDQLGDKFDTSLEGQRRDIDDLKGRLTIVESKKEAVSETSADLEARRLANRSQLIAAVSAVIAVVAVLLYAAQPG